jgi:magnesium transporter
MSRRKVHVPPGTLQFVGERKREVVEVEEILYTAASLQERTITPAEAVRLRPPAKGVGWVNIEGLHEVRLVEQLGDTFGIHRLLLEDILQTGQRPRFEDHGDYLFIVARMLRSKDSRSACEEEQVAMVVGRTFLLTFQEGQAGDVFGPIRQRLRQARGPLRGLGPDLLLHALLDAIVDQYFVVLEHLGDRIDELEDALLERPTHETLQELYTVKRELLQVRKAVWPLREVISGLSRNETRLIRAGTRPYMRDLYDHTIAVIDTIENFRERAAAMMELYLTSITIRTNDISKVLTIIATIFIPLTFISGVYGMNFDTAVSPWNMPELEWRYGYPAILLFMAAVAGFMILYFRRKDWW